MIIVRIVWKICETQCEKDVPQLLNKAPQCGVLPYDAIFPIDKVTLKAHNHVYNCFG